MRIMPPVREVLAKYDPSIETRTKVDEFTDEELEAMSGAEMERLCGISRQMIFNRIHHQNLSRREAMTKPISYTRPNRSPRL